MDNYVACLTILSAPLAIGVQNRMIRMIKEQRIVKDVQAGGHGLIPGTTQLSSWRD
jgi:hypothetical protein